MIRILAVVAVLALLSSPLWLVMLALHPQPRVLSTTSLSVDDVENTKRLLRENDPRSLRDGERKRVVLTEREINLLLRYGLPAGSAARVVVAPGLVAVASSTPVPDNPLGSYANIEVVFAQNGESLQPVSFTLGSTNMPGWVAGSLKVIADTFMRSSLPEYDRAMESLESIHADQGAVAITYRWRAELLEQVTDRWRELALPKEQRESILAYYSSLARINLTLRPGASLAEVLGPLFAQAARRSEEGADASDENRALILALGMAIQGANPNRLSADEETPVKAIGGLRVTLRGRRDLAQHFAISAALTAGGGGKLADAIGVFKELSDSQGGSGFSFPDLLADRAGVVFAERAIDGEAQRIQRLLAGEHDETVFMPPIDQLPEGLQDLEFRNRYEDLDTDTYNEVRGEVERRIARLALYR